MALKPSTKQRLYLSRSRKQLSKKTRLSIASRIKHNRLTNRIIPQVEKVLKKAGNSPDKRVELVSRLAHAHIKKRSKSTREKSKSTRSQYIYRQGKQTTIRVSDHLKPSRRKKGLHEIRPTAHSKKRIAESIAKAVYSK